MSRAWERLQHTMFSVSNTSGPTQRRRPRAVGWKIDTPHQHKRAQMGGIACPNVVVECQAAATEERTLDGLLYRKSENFLASCRFDVYLTTSSPGAIRWCHSRRDFTSVVHFHPEVFPEVGSSLSLGLNFLKFVM